TATAVLTLTVTPTNDAPIATADAASVAEDGSVLIDVLANDTDVETAPEALVLASVAQPARGRVAIEGGKVRYTPAADFNGVETFTYVVRDTGQPTGQSVASATGSVTVTVTPVNDAPTA